MVKIEQIVNHFQIPEEKRNAEIEERLKEDYGEDIKNVKLDPIYTFMMPRLNRTNSKEYQAMYYEMIRLKWDLDDGKPPIDYSSTAKELVFD